METLQQTAVLNRDLIGPKGKTIRAIQEQTGAEINVDDTGLVTIAAVGGEARRTGSKKEFRASRFLIGPLRSRSRSSVWR